MAEQVLSNCRALAVSIESPVTITDLAEARESAPPAQRSAPLPQPSAPPPQPTTPSTPPTSGYSESLQRQALEEMWSTTSAEEQRATCVVYSESPDAHIDGFMSQVGDALSESLVRRFYDSKC